MESISLEASLNSNECLNSIIVGRHLKLKLYICVYIFCLHKEDVENFKKKNSK